MKSETENLPPGFVKPEWWDAMWQSAVRHVAAQKPHGCICPPGSEATCKGWSCPRNLSTGTHKDGDRDP